VQHLSKQKGKCYTQCYEKNYAHLNPDDRDRIAVIYNKGTISREIDRNSSLEYDCYLGNRAQQRAGLRAKNSHNHHRLRNEDVRAYVLSHLEIGWSPEQISGRIGIDHPGWSISHESICQYIYNSGTSDRKHLIKCLRHSHRIRKAKDHWSQVSPDEDSEPNSH